jgi:Zn-dependent protease with chaperone function
MIQDSRDLISSDNKTALFFAIMNKNRLKNFNATAKDKQNIIFNNPNNLQVAVWLSKGIIGSLSEEEKTATVLHEIGHWVEFEPLFHETIFQHYAPATFALLALIKARSGELRADKFAARMGYSEEMEAALKKMNRGIRTNISILGKISDYNNVIHSAIHSYLDKKRGSYTHPNIDERIKNIKNVEEQMKVFEYIILREEALNEDLSNFFYSTVKLLISPLDKLVAKHVNLLFPLSK